VSCLRVPPGAVLSTIVVGAAHTHDGGPLSTPGSQYSGSLSSRNAPAATEQARASPQPSEELANGDLSLTSSRASGLGTTSGSWEGGADTSTLTFSQISPRAGRQQLLADADSAVAAPEANSGAPRGDALPTPTKVSPRKRREPAVKLAAFGSVSSAVGLRSNIGNERRSVSWRPQGLLGVALERFQTREAASHYSAVTESMGGTLLESEVPEGLPPDPAVSSRRRPSGPSVHVIQFDAEYGGSTTPFMSISSPGLSRVSFQFPRASAPQLSVGSAQMAAHPTEKEGATHTSVGEAEEPHMTSLPSTSTPAFATHTVPTVSLVEPLSEVCTPHTFTHTADFNTAQPLSPSLSPSTEMVLGATARPCRKINTSAATTEATAAGVGGDDDSSEKGALRRREFLINAESSSLPFQSTIVASSFPANSTTDLFEPYTSPHAQLPSLKEQKERAKIEYAEAAEFKKLRSLEVSESLARARKDRAVQRRKSKYAGDTLLHQLEVEEREQLHSSMRAHMRAVEAEHQRSMRELREKHRLQASPLQSRSPLLENQEKEGATAVTPKQRLVGTVAGLRAKINSPPLQMPPLNATPPLPPLASPMPPKEVCHVSRYRPMSKSANADAVAEIYRQRELKQHTPLPSSSLERLM
jgi:hypothetical protein